MIWVLVLLAAWTAAVLAPYIEAAEAAGHPRLEEL